MSAGFGRGRSTAAGSRVVRRSRFPANAHNLIAYNWLNTVMQSRRADYGRRIDTAAGQLRVACLARLSREERSVVAEVTYQLKLTRGQTRCAEQHVSVRSQQTLESRCTCVAECPSAVSVVVEAFVAWIVKCSGVVQNSLYPHVPHTHTCLQTAQGFLHSGLSTLSTSPHLLWRTPGLGACKLRSAAAAEATAPKSQSTSHSTSPDRR